MSPKDLWLSTLDFFRTPGAVRGRIPMDEKPDTCPTCGGPCTSEKLRHPPRGIGTATHIYHSLVKGEVVAEGWVDQRTLDWWNSDPSRLQISIWRGTAKEADGHDIHVLVIRMKEDSVIQERTAK